MQQSAMVRMSAKQARESGLLKPKKQNKYRAKKTVVDGIRFDSEREAQRYQTIKLLIDAGDYRDLIRQPKYSLMIGTVKIGEYRADFEYIDCITGATITEDVKGFATPLFRWKAKHFEAQYGRKIRVTK